MSLPHELTWYALRMHWWKSEVLRSLFLAVPNHGDRSCGWVEAGMILDL
jgi:hypothetical protein